MEKIDSKIGSLIEKTKRFEPLFFYFFIVINTLPLVLYKFFPTVDGAAHLHNSLLWSDIFFLGNDALENYYSLNLFSPNWLDHLFLGVLLVFLPAFMAEKILILIYLIGFPLSFRLFFKSTSSENIYLVYFIFPFTYSFMFMYGFYNFHLGLIFLFCFLALLNRYIKRDNIAILPMFVLMIISTLVSFSHLFVFSVLLLVVFLMNLSIIKAWFKVSKIEKTSLIRKLLCQFLALVPGIALLLYYMFSRPLIDQPYSSMDLNELLISIKTIQPAKAMDYGKEAIFTKWIFVSLVIITLAFFINQAGFYFNKKRNNAFFGRKNQMNVWLLISFVLLLCILFFPERMSGGSFISSRFLMMFFLFLIVGFAPVKLPLFIKVMIFVVINWVNVGLLKVYIEKNSEHSKVAEEVWNASKVIKHNKTIYPVTRTQNWLYPGISNYLGIDKPIVVLKNYEASQDYFPLKWNWDRLPDLMLGNQVGNNGCFTWPTQQSNPPRQIDYIFLFNDYNSEINDTCFVKLYDNIEKYFSWEYSSADGRIKIYRNNNISRLVGEWNLTEGNGYIEKWQFDDDTLMKGVGLSINNGITRITEKLAIVNSNSKISYLATVPGQNDGSTIAFHLVVSTDNSIVFENPEHDFPQRITYWFINDTTLKVDVESIDSTDNNFTMHFVKAGGQ